MKKLWRLLPLLNSKIIEEGVKVKVEEGEVKAIDMEAGIINMDEINNLTDPR